MTMNEASVDRSLNKILLLVKASRISINVEKSDLSIGNSVIKTTAPNSWKTDAF